MEPRALCYMDLAALSMLRGRHVLRGALTAKVAKARTGLGDWEAVMADAEAALEEEDVDGVSRATSELQLPRVPEDERP